MSAARIAEMTRAGGSVCAGAGRGRLDAGARAARGDAMDAFVRARKDVVGDRSRNRRAAPDDAAGHRSRHWTTRWRAIPSMLVFGEDVGAFGGVHRVDRRAAGTFGEERCFDTSLNEEGIVGRAGGHGDERLAAGAGDPVPQVRRPGARADHRRGQPALAHATGASAGRWCCASP